MAPRVPVKQRRAELIDAAFRVMARDGIQRASTWAICAEAGMSQSAFHYCFASKTELFRELIRTVITGMGDESLLMAGITDDVEESIRAGFIQTWSHATSHPEWQLVLYELTTHALRDPELADLASWQYEQYCAQTSRFLEEIAQRANIEWTVPAAVLSRMMATCIDGMVLGWLADRNDEIASQAFRQFGEFVAGCARPGRDRASSTGTVETAAGQVR
ncbi:MAG: TetR/AcrR family transcriptional regulator [Nocardioidaceae bacterium]